MLNVKVQQVCKNVNPFGGINFVNFTFKKLGIHKLIDNHLPPRPNQCKYSYSDIILGWIMGGLCGAQRLEDAHKIKNDFTGTPDVNIASPDRIAHVFKKMATKSLIDGKHVFNQNPVLSELLIKVAISTNEIRTRKGYTLDYDNVIIYNDKKDSAYTYDKGKGYQPGVCYLGNTPVYIQGRSGNSPASYKMKDTVATAMSLLDDHHIKVSRFRSDAAAYQKDVIEYFDSRKIQFFIRASNKKGMEIHFGLKTGWTELKCGGMTYKLREFRMRPFGSDKTYRYIGIMYETPEGKLRFSGKRYNYRAIVTNNWTMTPEEVFKFYNARGAIERNFDDLKNNFNWKRLPFSKLEENTAFMIISAIGKILYQSIIKRYSKKAKFIKKNWRLKAFRFNVISIAVQWVEDRMMIYTMQPHDYSVLIE